MKKILILGGGFSKERAISLDTAKSVLKALRKKSYKAIICEPDGKLINKIKRFKPNVVFNALHGRFGEDGYIQTILESIKVKYTHSGVVASYIAMDKEISNKLFSERDNLRHKSHQKCDYPSESKYKHCLGSGVAEGQYLEI